MHRLGTLAGLSNPSIAPSLSTGPAAPPLTLTPSTSPSSSGIASAPTLHSSASSVGITDKDNPWRTLHVHVLPLFNEEPLRIPIEDLNALVRRHIQTVLAVSPSKTLATLETDARELIAAGMVTLNAKLSNISDEILLGRVIEIWAFFLGSNTPVYRGGPITAANQSFIDLTASYTKTTSDFFAHATRQQNEWLISTIFSISDD